MGWAVSDELIETYETAIHESKMLIRKLVMQYGYPEEAKADMRTAHDAILAAEEKAGKRL